MTAIDDPLASELERLLARRGPAAPDPSRARGAAAAGDGEVDVRTEIARLARAALDGAPCDRAMLAALCRRVHVAREVRARYGPRWRRRDDAAPLDAPSWPLLVGALLGQAAAAARTDRGGSLKGLNAACAALDLARAAGADAGALDRLDALVEAGLASAATGVPAEAAAGSGSGSGRGAGGAGGAGEAGEAGEAGGAAAGARAGAAARDGGELPLVVLAHEGPGARLYLAALRRAGWNVRAVLLMVATRDPVTGRPVGRWLPRAARAGWQRRRQSLANHAWVHRLRLAQPALVEAIAARLGPFVDDGPALLDSVAGAFDWRRGARAFEPVPCTGLGDPALLDALARHAPCDVLYTGGGLVPRALLALDGVRVLHVHPGWLPDVRGADGLLWSTLVRGRPGASCFVMAPGIDTGPVLARREYGPLRIPVPARGRPADELLYRAIFCFLDPVLRAGFLLREVVGAATGAGAGGVDLRALTAVHQDRSAGITYHFVHPRLRAVGLSVLFPAR